MGKQLENENIQPLLLINTKTWTLKMNIVKKEQKAEKL